MKVGLSLIFGALGYVFGGIVAAILVFLLLVTAGATGATGITPAEPRGGELVFKIAWSVAVFFIGPISAAALPLAIYHRFRSGALVLTIVLALGLYSLTVWWMITPLSSLNDCAIGINWPNPSVSGCD